MRSLYIEWRRIYSAFVALCLWSRIHVSCQNRIHDERVACVNQYIKNTFIYFHRKSILSHLSSVILGKFAIWIKCIFVLNRLISALYGFITSRTRQKVVSCEADDVVHVDVEFKTSYGWFIDVVGRWKNRNGVERGGKFWTDQHFGQPRAVHVVKTWNTGDNPCSGNY